MGKTIVVGVAEGLRDAVTHPVDTARVVRDNFVARSGDVVLSFTICCSTLAFFA